VAPVGPGVSLGANFDGLKCSHIGKVYEKRAFWMGASSDMNRPQRCSQDFYRLRALSFAVAIAGGNQSVGPTATSATGFNPGRLRYTLGGLLGRERDAQTFGAGPRHPAVFAPFEPRSRPERLALALRCAHDPVRRAALFSPTKIVQGRPKWRDLAQHFD
jgi:hypothetical protein